VDEQRRDDRISSPLPPSASVREDAQSSRGTQLGQRSWQWEVGTREGSERTDSEIADECRLVVGAETVLTIEAFSTRGDGDGRSVLLTDLKTRN